MAVSKRVMAIMDDSEKKSIKIKPSKRGTFRTAAKKAGKSVQADAKSVLKKGSKASPAMKKKAVFAENAAKWRKK